MDTVCRLWDNLGRCHDLGGCARHSKKREQMNLNEIQAYLTANQLDGWLLYDFRGTNPVALHVAGLQSSGSRRWFLWRKRVPASTRTFSPSTMSVM